MRATGVSSSVFASPSRTIQFGCSSKRAQQISLTLKNWVRLISCTHDFEKNSKKREFRLRARLAAGQPRPLRWFGSIFVTFLRDFQRRLVSHRPFSIASPVVCVTSCIFNVNFIENNHDLETARPSSSPTIVLTSWQCVKTQLAYESHFR